MEYAAAQESRVTRFPSEFEVRKADGEHCPPILIPIPDSDAEDDEDGNERSRL